MRLTPVQRERLKNSGFYIPLPAVLSHVGKCLISLINYEISRRRLVERADFNSNALSPEGNIIFENGVNVLCVGLLTGDLKAWLPCDLIYSKQHTSGKI